MLAVDRPAEEDGNIGSARNFNQERLARSLIFEIASETLTQFGHIHSDDIVEAGVVVVGPSEHSRADLLFADGGDP